MIIFHEASTLQLYLQKKREKELPIGFVPTMGALHEGHLALLQQARKEGNFAVVSIFVNPTQFNDPKDFEKYPATIEEDIRLLEENGCDLLFLPTVQEMYPNGLSSDKVYDLGELENLWEGYYRPGHFQGVCQVVDRLLDLVHPDKLYMGLKDYQQCMVIRRLLELRNDQHPIQLIPCPTLRESDGLAMSSRNRRLGAEERQRAPMLYESLQEIRQHIQPGNTEPILEKHRAFLTAAGFRLDYLVIADAYNLQPVNEWDGKRDIVVLLAAFNGEVRLIDNVVRR